MAMKILAVAVAVALMLAFLAPYVIKMEDVALSIVILLGLGMMGFELWQSLRSKDD